jgi:hypothetical protein
VSCDTEKTAKIRAANKNSQIFIELLRARSNISLEYYAKNYCKAYAGYRVQMTIDPPEKATEILDDYAISEMPGDLKITFIAEDIKEVIYLKKISP